MFGRFLIVKIFKRWKMVINAKYYMKGRSIIDRTLDILDPDVRTSLDSCIQEIEQLSTRRIISVTDF